MQLDKMMLLKMKEESDLVVVSWRKCSWTRCAVDDEHDVRESDLVVVSWRKCSWTR
jgi:hypothetical protein